MGAFNGWLNLCACILAYDSRKFSIPVMLVGHRINSFVKLVV
jgi:hypothetical protein